MRSFRVAFRGLKILFFNERNFRTHMIFAFLAIVACIIFQVTQTEWIHVILLIGMVLSVEGLNTCIEYICDLVSPEYNALVEKIKDVAAGVVMLTAFVAVIVGCIIFIPYLIDWFI